MTYDDFLSCKYCRPIIIITMNVFSMNQQEHLFSLSQIAALLGVHSASIERWVDSGKLKCTLMQDGKKYFSTANLAEFAEQYNVSMKFLDEETKKFSMRKMMSTKLSAMK